MNLIRQFTKRGAEESKEASSARGSAPASGEATLVEAARRGDRGAFDALVSAYQPQLRGFLLRRVGADAVDDLMQDVWVASWLAMPRFQRRACFRTYLYSIAVNKCMDHHRAQARTAAALGTTNSGTDGEDTGAFTGVGGDPARLRSPEELYAAAETREAVRRLIDRLPPAQREVLDLYYYADLTLPEVAAVLKRNLNTVKYQFYRAHDLVGQGLTQAESGWYATPAAAGRNTGKNAAAALAPTMTSRAQQQGRHES